MRSVDIYQMSLEEYMRLENSVLNHTISQEEKAIQLSKAFLLTSTDHEIAFMAGNLHNEGKATRAEQPYSDLLVNHYGIKYSVLTPALYDRIKWNVERMTPNIKRIDLAAFYYLQYQLDTEMTIVTTDMS